MQRRAMMAGLALLALAACGRRPAERSGRRRRAPLPRCSDHHRGRGRRSATGCSIGSTRCGGGRGAAGGARRGARRGRGHPFARHGVQNRPWHFGSDGSSPVDRLQRVGYPGSAGGRGRSRRPTRTSSRRSRPGWRTRRPAGVILDPRATRAGPRLVPGAGRQDLVDDGAGRLRPAPRPGAPSGPGLGAGAGASGVDEDRGAVARPWRRCPPSRGRSRRCSRRSSRRRAASRAGVPWMKMSPPGGHAQRLGAGHVDRARDRRCRATGGSASSGCGGR